MAKTIPVLVETPQGSRSKMSFDFAHGLFRLTTVLPAGLSFPINFGCVPATLADDGDPLDVMLFMSDPVPPGTIAVAVPIGVLEAEQKEKGSEKKERNDRLIAVAAESPDHRAVRGLKDVGRARLRQFEDFFEAYNAEEGKVFRPLGWHGPKRAWRLVDRARRRYRKVRTRTLPNTFREWTALASDG